MSILFQKYISNVMFVFCFLFIVVFLVFLSSLPCILHHVWRFIIRSQPVWEQWGGRSPEANCVCMCLCMCVSTCAHLFVFKNEMRNSHANFIFSSERCCQTMLQGVCRTDVSNQAREHIKGTLCLCAPNACQQGCDEVRPVAWGKEKGGGIDVWNSRTGSEWLIGFGNG